MALNLEVVVGVFAKKYPSLSELAQLALLTLLHDVQRDAILDATTCSCGEALARGLCDVCDKDD